MNNSLLTDPHQRKLLKKWGAILESGKPIENESIKIVLAQILENTRNYYKMTGQLNEAGVPGGAINQAGPVGASQVMQGGGVLNGDFQVPYAGSTYGDFYLPNVVMPMLRRIMPDLIANELVGVQPLNGPVGYALAYRPTYNGRGGVGDNTPVTGLTGEIAYNPTDTRYTGAGADIDKSSFNKGDVTTSDYWAAYGGDAWLGTGSSLDKAEFADLTKGEYPTVSFSLVKSAVEAKTRKLAAHWSPELAEDMQAMHGIDVEREMVNTLTYEVGAEIDRQVVTEMVKAAIIGKSTSEWTPISADGLDQMGRLATLLTHITVEANNIALRTKRGNANFAITTPRVVGLLQQLSMNKFTSFKGVANLPSVPDTGVGALAKVGLINNDQQLLIRDSYVQNNDSDYVLLGYKGKQAGDSGIIYCPYIPLQLSKVMQPGTFTPSIGCRTRYGLMANPWDARNYYHFVKVDKVTTPYTWDTSRQFVAPVTAVRLPGMGGGNPVMPA